MKIVNRIKKSKDFAYTIKKGRGIRSGSFVIHTKDSSLSYTRVGVSVSSKLGNAVTRNRIKRQIRAMCGELIDFSKQSLDIVIIAKPGFLTSSYQDNKQLLKELLHL